MRTVSFISMYNNESFINKTKPYKRYYTEFLSDTANLEPNQYKADYIFVGSFVTEKDYHIIKAIKGKKILVITEPIEVAYKETFKLYDEGVFYMVIGCINHDPNDNKFKFPLYLDYFNYHDKEIFQRVNNLCKTQVPENFCTLINKHDRWNTRTPIYNAIKDLGHINCPSVLFKNCSNDELGRIDNIEYIRKFKFNICAENYRTKKIKGYITEKLMRCCLAGAIPIYNGELDDIDVKIFNRNRILFVDETYGSIKKMQEAVMAMQADEAVFRAFYEQDIFCDTAADMIILMGQAIKEKLK